MKQIEQAKAALQAAEEYLIADEVSVAHLHLDRALAALSAIEGSGEPVALSDEDFERMDDAFMRDGYPDHHTGTRIGRTHYMMWLRDKGHLKTSPSISVDEVVRVVTQWDKDTMYEPDRITAATLLRERLTKAIKRS